MKVKLKPGKYVVAVSGGVDSVALLHKLVALRDEAHPSFTFFVAHYDHGIRTDSAVDAAFVKSLAYKYGLEFFVETGNLGPKASEALARQKRYAFLHRVKVQVKADAIVTAHHQDDLIETALINLLRGTNRKGLSSLRSTSDIKRPLLGFSKKELAQYAEDHSLSWHEDSTNQEDTYLRNNIRHNIVPRLSDGQRAQLLEILSQAKDLNDTIDTLLAAQLAGKAQSNELDRLWFIGLPHALSREIMAAWLRQNSVDLERPMLERLVVTAKTKAAGKQADVQGKLVLRVEKHKLALYNRDR